MEKKKAMIMCTCAEFNSEVYLKYVAQWIEQFKGTIDLYVINDGEVCNQQLESSGILGKVHFVNLSPALGRKGFGIFPGFCRSLAKGLEISLKYKYFALVENDLKLLNTNKFRKLLYAENQCFSGYSRQNAFIESSLVIINDVRIREEIYRYYSIPENQFKDHCLERQLESFLQKGNYKKCFKGARYEGMPERLKFCKDYIAQYYDKHGDESDIDKLASHYRKIWVYYPNMFIYSAKKKLDEKQ